MRSCSWRPDRVREADAQDAAHLLKWLGMVVHSEVNQAITVATNPVTRRHDHQCRRLLATPVATGGLACGQRRDEAVPQGARADRKCLRHRRQHRQYRWPHQQVALAGVIGSYLSPCPVRTRGAGVGRWRMRDAHDPHRPMVAKGIWLREALDGRGGREAASEEGRAHAGRSWC